MGTSDELSIAKARATARADDAVLAVRVRQERAKAARADQSQSARTFTYIEGIGARLMPAEAVGIGLSGYQARAGTFQLAEPYIRPSVANKRKRKRGKHRDATDPAVVHRLSVAHQRLSEGHISPGCTALPPSTVVEWELNAHTAPPQLLDAAQCDWSGQSELPESADTAAPNDARQFRGLRGNLVQCRQQQVL